MEIPIDLPLDDEYNKGCYYTSIYHSEALIAQISLESSEQMYWAFMLEMINR